MIKRILKFLWRLVLALGIMSLAIFILPRLITFVFSLDRIYQMEDAPTDRLAIVFGAGLRRDGTPTAILRDRVETAAKLYFDGKVEKILMSGDRSENYNEPESMRQYAMFLGVPSEAITLDYAGRRTYDTCYPRQNHFQGGQRLAGHAKISPATRTFYMQHSGIKSAGCGGEQQPLLERLSTDLERPGAVGNCRSLFGPVGEYPHTCPGRLGADIRRLVA